MTHQSKAFGILVTPHRVRSRKVDPFLAFGYDGGVFAASSKAKARAFREELEPHFDKGSLSIVRLLVTFEIIPVGTIPNTRSNQNYHAKS